MGRKRPMAAAARTSGCERESDSRGGGEWWTKRMGGRALEEEAMLDWERGKVLGSVCVHVIDRYICV